MAGRDERQDAEQDGTGKPAGPNRRRASASIDSTCSTEYSGWVMTRCAPAASFRSRRSHSVAASAAVESRAQAIVNPARWPIDAPVGSSARLSRVRISIRPIESTSQTPVPVG